MTYDLTIKENSDHIRLEISGSWTPGQEAEDVKSVWIRVAGKSRVNNVCRILAIWNIPNRLPTLAAYNMTKATEEFGWSRRFKLAVVYSSGQRLQDSLFGEDIGVNRGYNIKMFNNEQDAKSWLLES